MDADVLVIGGGVAGAAAALAAQAAGARTLLVRAGPGATALAAGGWTGEPPAALRQALAGIGFDLVPCAALLPHPDGRLLHADYAPPSHAAAAWPRPAASMTTLVCGIAGLPFFRPSALAALWRDAAPHAAGAHEGAAHAVVLTLPDTPLAGWAAASAAAYIERETGPVAELFAAAAREHTADLIIMPAVLGIDEHTRAFDIIAAAVSAAAGATLGEALGTAPSLPGLRLDRALLRALDDAGVSVITGRVTQRAAHTGIVQSVTVERDGAVIVITPRIVILASGKYTGGGIAADPHFVETVLGTRIEMRRFGRAFEDVGATLALTDPVRVEPQPILGLGIATDAESRPVSASGDVAFSNVFIAGSVRADVETASLGLGTAALDGWTVGQRAAELAAGDRAWA